MADVKDSSKTTEPEPRLPLTVDLPKGPLGIVLEKGIPGTDQHIFVGFVSKSSQLFGKIQPGDWLRFVDTVDVKAWNVTSVKKLFEATDNNEKRTVGLLRKMKDAESIAQFMVQKAQERNHQSTPNQTAAAAKLKPKATPAAKPKAKQTPIKKTKITKITPAKFTKKTPAKMPTIRAVSAASRKSRRVAGENPEGVQVGNVSRAVGAVRHVLLTHGTSEQKRKLGQETIMNRSTEKKGNETSKTTKPAVDPVVENINPYLPKALQNLKDYPGLVHRPEVKEQIVRMLDLHESAQLLNDFLEDDRVKPGTTAHDRLGKVITELRKEKEAVISLPNVKLTDFERKLRLLVAFRIKNGHCRAFKVNPKVDATPDEKELGNFVSSQRQRKKKREKEETKRKGIHALSYKDDMEFLERLGFEFVVGDQAIPWEDNLEALKEFKKEHGHTKVPQLYAPNQKLASWVHSQRRDHDKFCSGLHSPMTPERIQLLEQVGFVWKVRFGRPKKSDPKYRNKRYLPGEGEPKSEDGQDSIDIDRNTSTDNTEQEKREL